jgi:hypothetical protein
MKIFLPLLAGSVLLLSVPAFAQEPPPDCNASEDIMKTKPYTRDQGDICIREWETKVKELQEKLNGLNGSVQKLNASLENEKSALKKCNDDIAALLGASDRDVENFGQRLGVLEGKVRAMKGLGDDALADRQADVRALEDELNKMRGEKIAVHPKYYNRIIELAREIKSLYREKKVKDYLVGTWAENRDCLWNIAGKAEIYNDPFQWPKIWQGNTDQIRNPDLIRPGQRLKLPPAGPKTSDEMKAERSYWRKKRAAMMDAEKKADAAPAVETPAAAPAEKAKPGSVK